MRGWSATNTHGIENRLEPTCGHLPTPEGCPGREQENMRAQIAIIEKRMERPTPGSMHDVLHRRRQPREPSGNKRRYSKHAVLETKPAGDASIAGAALESHMGAAHMERCRMRLSTQIM
jgi:hypothetical protein